MKKLFISIALVATGVAAIAQTSTGTLMLGGSLGFNSRNGGEASATIGTTTTTTKKTAITNWNFSPTVGYFLMDDLAVGLRLGLGGTTRGQVISGNGKNTENYSSFDLGFELFGRYYMKVTDNLYLFGDAGIGYSTASWTARKASTTDTTGFIDGDAFKDNSISLNVAPGLTYFPSEKWGIDLTLNRLLYFTAQTQTQEAPSNGPKSENKSNDFGIGLGLNPSLGLHYYFGK